MGGSEGIVGLGGEGPEVHAVTKGRGPAAWPGMAWHGLRSRRSLRIKDAQATSNKKRHDLHKAHMASRDYTITTNKPHTSVVGGEGATSLDDE